MEKTAVEWLVEQLDPNIMWTPNAKELYKQAKKMEKQQIIDARITAPLFISIDKSIYLNEAEQYYKETFKSK